MIYKEDYVGRAHCVEAFVHLLKVAIPKDATIEVDAAYGEHTTNVEVWYDKDTNTVILK